jgi:lipoprotein NlpI
VNVTASARVAILLLCALASVAPDVATAGPHPLLDYARARDSKREMPKGASPQSGVRMAQHAIDQAHVPPAAECAASLGAARFAGLYSALGAALGTDGDFAGAAQAYRAALQCRPHDALLHAALASSLFDARDYAGARAAVDAALAIDPRAVETNRLAGNLDFIAERWPEAIARFRYTAASDANRTHAAYGQLMYWLAQARAGVAHPEFVARTPTEGWPQPLLLHLTGEYTEQELIEKIKAGDEPSNDQPNTSSDERLCEALFYVGEWYWARGDRETARDYFAALVNLRVIYFLEHGLALAEIAKLR